MPYAFNSSTPSLRDAVNRLNRASFKTQGDIESIVAGGGSIAPNASVEKAVQWMIMKCSGHNVTYTMDLVKRNLCNPNGMSFDCSSFVITAFDYAGFHTGAHNTQDMRSGFTQLGWQWIPGSYFASDVLQRGDILLNIVNHTQVYIGGNQDANCGSTPAKIVTHNPYYRYNGAQGWDGVLRYAG